MKGRLRISYDRNANKIEIVGDRDGLRYLADACMRVIDKEGPGAHFHLMKDMKNLHSTSIDADVIYDDAQ